MQRKITDADGNTTMIELPMIYEAVSKAMADIGAVTKDDWNGYDKYKFRGIDAVLNALNPALKKNGITIVPTVLEQIREERQSEKGKTMIYSILTVNYKFFALDGSFIEATVIGEGMDRGDKASNKAMSSAFKYACFQTFCIPTEEMIDSEVDSPTVVPKGKETITASQSATIKSLLEETESDVKTFLSYYKVNSVDEMDKTQFQSALQKLNKKKEGMK